MTATPTHSILGSISRRSVSVTVRGSADGEVPLVVSRAGTVVAETSVRLVNGTGRADFTDRIGRPGAFGR